MHEKRDRIIRVLPLIAAIWLTSIIVFLRLPNAGLAFAFSAVTSIVLVCYCVEPKRMLSFGSLLFRWRWVCALLLFAICVALRLHGSSIGVYDEMLPTQISAGESTLFGIPRWIRSDEFGVATPTFFSQAHNDFNMYSQLMSVSPTNMVLDYYSPVLDIAVLGKPLQWGFLLFGNEIGLSWYWCSEEILLFMLSLEACLILTRRNRVVSVAGSLMIALSPAIQWWVVPHIPIVFMYALALFVLGYASLTTQSIAGKISSSIGLIFSIVGFALSLFPALQVPLAYIVAILLGVCAYRDRGVITLNKQLVARLIMVFLCSVIVIVRFVYLSQEDISALMNTSYPGDRVILGGSIPLQDLFPSLASFFFPFKDSTYLNNCEAVTYIHAAPLFFVLLPRIILYAKRLPGSNVSVGIALACILVVEAVFMVVGIPEPIAYVTQLRYCNRMGMVYGFTATLFTVWGLSFLMGNPGILQTWQKAVYPLLYVLVCIIMVREETWGYFAQFGFAGQNTACLLAVASASVIGFIVVLAILRERLAFLVVVLLAFSFCGATINPLERGAGAISNHPISSTIGQIADREPESTWLCIDCTFFLSNYVMSNGARVLDATNFYPDREKWRILDLENEFYEITNRYANESAVLAEGRFFVESPWPDALVMHLNPESLRALSVTYLFTPNDYSKLLEKHGISCSLVTEQDGYGIYRLEYHSLNDGRADG